MNVSILLKALLLFVISGSCVAVRAQDAREYPVMVRERMAVANEQLVPAPPGWGARLIGVRNIAPQRLASLVFYDSALHPFSEISLPQSYINDVTPLGADSGAVLLMLATRRDSLWFLPVDARRTPGAGCALQPGEHLLLPSMGSARFVGVIPSSPAQPDTQIIIAYSFFDQPLRHVIASYTLRGVAVWQMLIGAGALHAQLISDPSDARERAVLFSSDAAAHETADTLRLSARRSHVGAVSATGVAKWVRSYGGPGTTCRCVPAPRRGAVLCAVRTIDSAEVVMLDARDGRERHFARLAGDIAQRTLCIDDDGAAVAVMPDQIARFDSSMRAIGRTRISHAIDTDAVMTPLNRDTYVLFSADWTDVLDADFGSRGMVRAGMTHQSGGLARFSGTPIGGDAYIASTPSGAAIRAIEPNVFWWWFRYRVPAAIIVGLLLIGAALTRGARRFTFYRTYYIQLVRGSVSTGVVTLNRQMRVLHLNNAARELLHIAPYIPLERHFTEYVPDAAFSEIVNVVRDCVQTRATLEKIITLQAGGQPRTVLCRARPTLTRTGSLAGCLLQLEDITRTIERERMISWASVAHHVAHEMKTPIGTVLLNAQHVLKSEDELPDRARKYFHRIVTQAERLSGILQNFLTIARVSTMRFAQMDVVHLVQSITADYAELLPARVTMSFHLGHVEDTHHAIDDQQFTTALRNILDNAVHAIAPNEGAITVSIDEYPMPPSGAIAITVRDTGKGMTDECRARLFEPFYTETPGGSGIGMVIVKRIIDEHKGFIEVNSEVGVGTEIRIVLPRE